MSAHHRLLDFLGRAARAAKGVEEEAAQRPFPLAEPKAEVQPKARSSRRHRLAEATPAAIEALWPGH